MPEDAKYLLGRGIQASILSSHVNYHFFEQVHAMIKNKTRGNGRDEGKDIKPRVVEDVKPKVEDLDARRHKRTRHQSPEVIEIDQSPSPEPRPRRPTTIRLTSPPVAASRAVTAPPFPPVPSFVVPSVQAGTRSHHQLAKRMGGSILNEPSDIGGYSDRSGFGIGYGD